jgi:hypothetical protein
LMLKRFLKFVRLIIKMFKRIKMESLWVLTKLALWKIWKKFYCHLPNMLVKI